MRYRMLPVLLLAATVAAAQPVTQPAAPAVTLPLPVARPSATDDERNLQRFLVETQQLDPSIRELAIAELSAVAVVFVPGILGSQLTLKSGERIWPPASLHFEKLKLPAALLQENAPPDLEKPTVLGAWGPMEFYGSALRKTRASLGRLGITTLIECGYDWRRDIRAGAADLHRCLGEHGLLDPRRTVIFVAHSMGGLVTWSWHDLYYRQPTGPVPRVRGFAALGSPLEGACETLRMIAEGYKQPTEKDRAIPDTFVARAVSAWKAKWESIENEITAALSNATVRPLMFTWPGAFELLPASTSDPMRSCVSEDEPAAAPELPRPWYTLSDRFWEPNYPGSSVINMPRGPAELPAVLAKAREFREWFRAGERAYPPVPLFVYRSDAWLTPTQMLTLNQAPAANTWGQVKFPGDGRVTKASAQLAGTPERDPQGRFTVADLVGTSFVHGALLDDPVVQDAFFAQRLPQIVNAHVAVLLAQRLTASDALLREYVRRRGQQATLDWHAVFTGLEYRPGTRGAPETERDRAIVDAYNAALRARGALPAENYAEAVAMRAPTDARQQAILGEPLPPEKKVARVQGLAAAYQLAAARLQLVARSPKTSPEQVVFAEAHRGLVLNLAGDYLTAASVLTEVSPRLAAIPDTFDRRDPSRIKRLKDNVRANLGIALWETGQCALAKSYLEQSLANPRAKERYDTPCLDRAVGRAVDMK